MSCDVIAKKASKNPIGALKMVACKKCPALWGKNSRSLNPTIVMNVGCPKERCETERSSL